MNPYKKLVGDRIQARRIQLGISSQDRLADLLVGAGARNVDQSRISRWESGNALPGRYFRPFLLNVLNLTEDQLFGRISLEAIRTADTPPEEPSAVATNQIAVELKTALQSEFGLSPEEHILLGLFRSSRDDRKDHIIDTIRSLVERDKPKRPRRNRA